MNKLELNEFFDLLVDDRKAGAQFWADTGSDYSKRSYVHAVFAFIEGHTERMKKICFLAHKNGLTTLEESQLNFIYGKTSNGKQLKLGVEKNIKCTLKLFSETFGNDYRLNTSGVSWSKFQLALKIRHRLMHPKSPNEFKINDSEMLLIEEAASFLRESTIELVKA